MSTFVSGKLFHWPAKPLKNLPDVAPTFEPGAKMGLALVVPEHYQNLPRLENFLALRSRRLVKSELPQPDFDLLRAIHLRRAVSDFQKSPLSGSTAKRYLDSVLLPSTSDAAASAVSNNRTELLFIGCTTG